MKRLIFIPITLVLAANDCAEQPPAETKDEQARKAKEAAGHLNFTENAEIENITKRLTLTSKPGLLGYVVLLNQMGQPVMYTTVKGKLTSGTKRLTQPWQAKRFQVSGAGWSEKDVPAPSDEGTWGSSSEYIYFWTQSGQYIQWNGPYLYSDQPFRLSQPTLVVETAKARPE